MRRNYTWIVAIMVVSLFAPWRASLDLAYPYPAMGLQSVGQSGAPRLEDGTPVKIRLSQTISSATSNTNDRVEFDVLDEVKVGNLVVIPKGSIAWGTVTEAQAKRRMGKGGKLDVNIDAVRLADGEKAALRGVKDVKGGGHTGAMTGAVVATSLVLWPAAPFFLFMHGKDITIPEGTELTVYVNGDFSIDPAKFGGGAIASSQLVSPTMPTTVTQPAAAGDSNDPARPAARNNARALSKDEIVGLLKGQVPDSRVVELVKRRSISFTPTEDDYKEIRAAGGGDDLINVLKAEVILQQ